MDIDNSTDYFTTEAASEFASFEHKNYVPKCFYLCKNLNFSGEKWGAGDEAVGHKMDLYSLHIFFIIIFFKIFI